MRERFCPDCCLFKQENADCDNLPLECYHFEDRAVEPFDLILDLPSHTKVVTVVGENNHQWPKWILSDGSSIHKKAPWIRR